MARFTMLAVAILSLAGVSNARGQDTDEVKRLKEKVELLQAKLEAAILKVEKLQAELDQAKKGGGKPTGKEITGGAPENSVWKGKHHQERTVAGKVERASTSVKLVVTERTDKGFKAEYTMDNFGVLELEGTIDRDGKVKWGVLRIIEGKEKFHKDVVGGLTGSGPLKDKRMSMKWSIKNTDFAGKIEVELQD